MKTKIEKNEGIDGMIESNATKLYAQEHSIELRGRINRMVKFRGIEAALGYLGIPYGQPAMALAINASHYAPPGGGLR
ncbi:MAG: hypothetical protein V1866_01920 [archaeon]